MSFVDDPKETPIYKVAPALEISPKTVGLWYKVKAKYVFIAIPMSIPLSLQTSLLTVTPSGPQKSVTVSKCH